MSAARARSGSFGTPPAPDRSMLAVSFARRHGSHGGDAFAPVHLAIARALEDPERLLRRRGHPDAVEVGAREVVAEVLDVGGAHRLEQRERLRAARRDKLERDDLVLQGVAAGVFRVGPAAEDEELDRFVLPKWTAARASVVRAARSVAVARCWQRCARQATQLGAVEQGRRRPWGNAPTHDARLQGDAAREEQRDESQAGRRTRVHGEGPRRGSIHASQVRPVGSHSVVGGAVLLDCTPM